MRTQRRPLSSKDRRAWEASNRFVSGSRSSFVEMIKLGRPRPGSRRRSVLRYARTRKSETYRGNHRTREDHADGFLGAFLVDQP